LLTEVELRLYELNENELHLLATTDAEVKKAA